MASALVSANTFVPSKLNIIDNVPKPNAFSFNSFPVIDFSALLDHDRRSKALHDLAAACREWGSFILVNHGVPETLMKSLFRETKEFFNLPESEKKQMEAKCNADPIKFGSVKISDASNQIFSPWRDYLTLYVHPEFHCPNQPQLLSEVAREYTDITREIGIKLIEGVCDALELDRGYVHEVLKLDSSFQILTANYYPPTTHSEQVIAPTWHTDKGLLTLLMHNGVAGLQIEHKGQSYDYDSPHHNALLVNVSDQLEIFTNGKCKSVKHRAAVNEETERFWSVVNFGPSPDVVVGPAAPLMRKDGRGEVNSTSMKYKDYVESVMMKIPK